MSEIKPWRENIGKPEAYMIMCDVLNVLCEKEAIKKAVYERLKQAPSTYEWIPCSERLPEEGERILVTAALEHVMVAHYGKMFFEKERGNVFYLAGEDGDADITDVVVAWMPLPEPYREEGD